MPNQPRGGGSPILTKMLKGMEKARVDATKAQARGSKGQQANTFDVGRTTGMQASLAQSFNEIANALFARALLQAVVAQANAPASTFGQPRDAATMPRMGPDWLRR